jgi:hypothetical protein
MPEELAAMAGYAEQLNFKIERGATDGHLMESAVKNIHALLKGAPSDLYSRAVDELISATEWQELIVFTGRFRLELAGFAVGLLEKS